MNNKDYNQWAIALIVLQLFSLYFLSQGLDAFVQGWTAYLFCLLLVPPYFIIRKRINQKITGLNYPGEKEIEREDKTIPSYFIFLQSLIFIIINELIQTSLKKSIKIYLVSITFFFVTLRNYAHIRDNEKWRWRSNEITFILFISEIFGFVWISLGEYLSNFSNIQKSVIWVITILVISLIPALFNAYFKPRYFKLND